MGDESEVSGSRPREVKGAPAPLGCSLVKLGVLSWSPLVGPDPLQG